MSGESSAVMDALAGLNAGDDVRLTMDRDGEELELDGCVTDAYRAEPEQLGFGWNPGDLQVDVDLTNETVAELDVATHSLDVRATERKPGKWKRVSTMVYDPEVEDGEVVTDAWTDMGDITDVEVVDGERDE